MELPEDDLQKSQDVESNLCMEADRASSETIEPGPGEDQPTDLEEMIKSLKSINQTINDQINQIKINPGPHND